MNSKKHSVFSFGLLLSCLSYRKYCMSPFPSDTLLSSFAPLTPVPHCESIRAHIAPDFFTLWESYEKEQGHITEIPYWAAVWPGAKSLASYILKNPSIVNDKTVLDFGCGSGVGSIAAKKAGAKHVIANDIDPIALYISNLNFKANNVDIFSSNHNYLSTNNNSIQNGSETKIDLILVSDMFYERSTAQPLHNFLNKSILEGSKVLIADGTRPFTPRSDLEKITSEVISVNQALEGMSERKVTLFWMNKGSQ